MASQSYRDTERQLFYKIIETFFLYTGPGDARRHTDHGCKDRETQGYRSYTGRIRCADVWDGGYERRRKTSGGCAGIYRDSDDVFPSAAGDAGGCAAHCYCTEFFCFGGYSAGALCHWRCFLCNGDPHHNGTEYWYLRDGASFIRRGKPQCQTGGAGASVF